MENYIYFAATDVDHFHIEMRAAFDNLALLIRSGVGRGQTPFHFSDLKRNCLDGKHPSWLPPRLVAAVVACEWFDDLKRVRDDLTHFGADSLVFPDEQHILFQVHKGSERRVSVSHELMFNENVVYFARYEATLIAYLESLLGDLHEWLAAALADKPVGAGSMFYHDGWGLSARWAAELVAAT